MPTFRFTYQVEAETQEEAEQELEEAWQEQQTGTFFIEEINEDEKQ